MLLGRGISFASFGAVFAADLPDSYQIEVSPTSFSTNQAVDITVKAIKNKKVMTNYEGTAFLSIEGLVEGRQINLSEYTVSAWGIIDLTLADQGVKKYSKGLSIAKPGTFTIKVAHILEDAISGSTTAIVTSSSSTNLSPIQVLSPSAGLEESQSTINVMATAESLPNARVQVLLNDIAVKEVTSDANGLINDTISGLKVGTNYIQLKAVSVAGETVWQSEKVVFTYQPQSEDLLKSLTVMPNQNLKAGNKVRFELLADDAVSSAKLRFPNGQEYPLDKAKDGLFTKDIMLIATWTVEVSATLSAGDLLKKEYEKILTLEVADNTQIGDVKIQASTVLAGAIQLDWKVIGEAPSYAVQYGLTRDELLWRVITQETKLMLSGFTYGKNYYFQVIPLNAENIADGIPSEIMEFMMPISTGAGPDLIALSGAEFDHPSAELPTCVVKNIKVATQKIWNKYYLVWDRVDNATKYLIYKSDYADNTDKAFVGETELTRFEYPFDKTSEEDVYAYYTVEALCADGNKALLTEAQKVKVGPIEDMMLILTMTTLGYLLYRLYYYRID